MVQIKFIAPNIEAIPDKCRLNISKSTDTPECVTLPDNGGYIVQPVTTTCSQSIATYS